MEILNTVEQLSVLLPSPWKVENKQVVAQLSLTVSNNLVMKVESTLFIACFEKSRGIKVHVWRDLRCRLWGKERGQHQQYSLLHRLLGSAQLLWTSISEENTWLGLSLPSHRSGWAWTSTHFTHSSLHVSLPLKQSYRPFCLQLTTSYQNMHLSKTAWRIWLQTQDQSWERWPTVLSVQEGEARRLSSWVQGQHVLHSEF